MSHPNSETQKRFSNLLELAKRSKFRGERNNALSAAKRIAEKHGMTIKEFEKGTSKPKDTNSRPWANKNRQKKENIANALFKNVNDSYHEKERWQRAVNSAKARGLDENIRKRENILEKSLKLGKNKRPAGKHAEVLLKETSLSFKEITEITGLNIYQVVGIKLKLRTNIIY